MDTCVWRPDEAPKFMNVGHVPVSSRDQTQRSFGLVLCGYPSGLSCLVISRIPVFCRDAMSRTLGLRPSVRRG